MLVSFVLAAAGKEQLVGTAAATNHSTASPTVMRLFNAQKPRVSAAFPDLIRLHWIVSLDQEGEQRFWKSEHVIHHSKLNHPNPQTNPQTPATTCNNDLKSPVKLHSLREVSWFNKNNNALLGAQRALAYFVVRCPWRLVLKAWVLLGDRLGWYLPKIYMFPHSHVGCKWFWGYHHSNKGPVSICCRKFF